MAETWASSVTRDAMRKVFAYLDPVSRTKCERVCKGWLEILRNSSSTTFPTVSDITLRITLTDAPIEPIVKLRQIDGQQTVDAVYPRNVAYDEIERLAMQIPASHLSIYNGPLLVTPILTRFLRSRVTFIEIHDTLDGLAVDILQSLPNLETVIIDRVDLNMAQLLPLPQVRRITLSNTQLDCGGLLYLARNCTDSLREFGLWDSWITQFGNTTFYQVLEAFESCGKLQDPFYFTLINTETPSDAVILSNSNMKFVFFNSHYHGLCVWRNLSLRILLTNCYFVTDHIPLQFPDFL